MKSLLKEHDFALAVVLKIVAIILSYFFIGVGWWLIADVLNINTESLRFLDWVMIAIFTKVLLFNNAKFINQ